MAKKMATVWVNTGSPTCDYVEIHSREPSWDPKEKEWCSAGNMRDICNYEFRRLFGVEPPPWPECKPFRVPPLIPFDYSWVPA